jgi:S-formylglutathione hydrolase FrmB
MSVAMRPRTFSLLALAAVCSVAGAPSASALEDGVATPAERDASVGRAPDGTTSPWMKEPAAITIDEEEEAVVEVRSNGIARFDVDGLPPGAVFDPARGKISFRPDFTQSGTYRVLVTGHGRSTSFMKTVPVVITVRDSIAPPDPVVVRSTVGRGFTRLVVHQRSDDFLDSPGYAGRLTRAVVVVPHAATALSPLPVVVSLHGLGGGPRQHASSTDSFRIEPYDPWSTYWWGYGESLPAARPQEGRVPPYTARRVLHLLSWVLRTYKAADADRVFVSGTSMGGSGALTIGLLHARHFAGIEATLAQAIPRNHRPSRIAQLTQFWGAPSRNVDGTWDRIDVTRLLRDLPEARDQFVFTKHGKDDGTIHFGAAVMASPLTRKSLYAALEEGKIGHFSVWDEGGHGPYDPVLGRKWWDAGWNRITDKESYLTRRLPFPAFTRSSANEAPGNGSGNGKTRFDPERGYAARASVAGDCGWSGSLAGALNRFLRWDTSRVVDSPDRLELPLRVVTSPGEPPPKRGYPTKGDLYTGPLPIRVDVTPRRVHAFLLTPGERVRYRFGALTGTETAASDGSVTIPSLPVAGTTTVLELERESSHLVARTP